MEILKNKAKVLLLGNEAIVRGALESGVQFVTSYPGTPASEIGDTFAKIQNLYFEYSANEKVALEAAVGASWCGLKTLVAMKHFGLNVALDSLIPFCYTGCNGATVIVVADDPSCHSSAQSEENTRAFAELAHLPVLEPADPEECRNFTKLAFELSEKYRLPVMLRTTTRVAHQRMPVALGELPVFGLRASAGRPAVKSKFIKNPKQYVTMPPAVLEMKKELLEKIQRIKKEISEKSSLNKIYRGRTPESSENGKAGIIASGISFLYVMEALKEFKINLPVLKIGMFYPLAEGKIKKFIRNLRKVLVAEELEPYLENSVAQYARAVNPKLRVFGKNLLPETGEFRPEYVSFAIAKLAGKKIAVSRFQPPTVRAGRLPKFCAGCAYWRVFAAVKEIAPKDAVFAGDIGCYMMAAFLPFELYDFISCMGSSIGIGHGISKALRPAEARGDSTGRQKVIAFIGDSTFFHSGIPALVNAVHNQSDMLVIIMDNRITAMTGHQPHPGIPLAGNEKQGSGIKIEKVVRALGIKNLKVIDPVKNFSLFRNKLKEFLTKNGVSVIIARHPCWLYYGKRKDK